MQQTKATNAALGIWLLAPVLAGGIVVAVAAGMPGVAGVSAVALVMLLLRRHMLATTGALMRPQVEGRNIHLEGGVGTGEAIEALSEFLVANGAHLAPERKDADVAVSLVSEGTRFLIGMEDRYGNEQSFRRGAVTVAVYVRTPWP